MNGRFSTHVGLSVMACSTRLSSPWRARRRRRAIVGRAASSGAAFTLLETLVVVAIGALLLGVLLVTVTHVRRSAEQPLCVNNLRQIGFALNQFATDHNGVYPNPEAQETSWEYLIRSYLGSAKVFRCGVDAEVYPSVGSSYDWRDTGKEKTTLAGKSRASVGRTDVVMAFEALPGWHEKTKINAAWIDGSAHVMDREQCLDDLAKAVRQ
jgi:type II secretory pathway pseudopilin PulG